MHRLLARQLRKTGLDPESPPSDADAWRDFLARVERSYLQVDEDRYLREHTMDTLSREMRTLHETISRSRTEHAALGRVATAVAEGEAAEAIFDLVAREVAGLLGYAAARVLRFADHRAVEVGSWGTTPALAAAGGEAAAPAVTGPGAVARVFRSEALAFDTDLRGMDEPFARGLAGLGLRGLVAAPIRVDARLWGTVVAVTSEPGVPCPTVVRCLTRFADLIALAISNAEDRNRLATLAATDSLTGLANHRAFQERLAIDAARARRHATPLCLLLLDLDAFKAVNDTLGHSAGDAVLVALADRMREGARQGDLLARVGGEEFAWLLPETGLAGGLEAAERLRTDIASGPLGPSEDQTVSIGLCDLATAGGDPAELFRLADGALYWAKRSGRNMSVSYSPEVVVEMSPAQRAQRETRARSLAAIQALARAVDARDSNTRVHSDRVAVLCALLAEQLGWDGERTALLREAAIVHDVGKIGVPDSYLLKPGPLEPEEYERLKEHAVLGAWIVPDVLSPEQTSWVRHHHERWDGRGYPDGLAGADIPEGAAVIAVADAWDAMISTRPYRAAMSPAEALEECRDCSGTHFSPAVVAALESLVSAGRVQGLVPAAGAVPGPG